MDTQLQLYSLFNTTSLSSDEREDYMQAANRAGMAVILCTVALVAFAAFAALWKARNRYSEYMQGETRVPVELGTITVSPYPAMPASFRVPFGTIVESTDELEDAEPGTEECLEVTQVQVVAADADAPHLGDKDSELVLYTAEARRQSTEEEPDDPDAAREADLSLSDV